MSDAFKEIIDLFCTKPSPIGNKNCFPISPEFYQFKIHPKNNAKYKGKKVKFIWLFVWKSLTREYLADFILEVAPNEECYISFEEFLSNNLLKEEHKKIFMYNLDLFIGKQIIEKDRI